MASLEELREERLKKLSLLKERGISAYPAETRRDREVRDAIASFDELQEKGATLTLAGRVRTLRAQGALIFFDFDDGTGVFQGLIKKDEIGDDQFSLFEETVDGGDFVEVAGTLFLTKRGEKTLAVNAWRMLAKALRPLPDKWHGLADVEERYRKRYLDLLMSPEVKAHFLLRSRVIAFLRAHFDGEGFVEVETPVLQPLYGGASAEPFTTHHNALDMDFYLRISDELYLKRLLI
ncbi:MAG: lysine--tRNA ligase, partial [Candidatus Liptonbacteria bacterium]|nr:lysine--tRNA ligase [Candidatus Liptonbacteria bacterium]